MQLNDVVDNNCILLTEVEYLHIIYTLDLIKHAKIDYIDTYIAGQYLQQCRILPLNKWNETLIHKFKIDNPEVLKDFVKSQYLVYINSMLVYFKTHFTNPDKYYFIPLPFDIRKSVDQLLINSMDKILNIFVDSVNNCSNTNTSLYFTVDNEELNGIEAVAVMLKGNFTLYQDIQTRFSYYNKEEEMKNLMGNDNTPVNIELYNQFINKLADILYTCNPGCKDLVTIASILQIFTYLVCPHNLVPDDPDKLYKGVISTIDTKKVKNLLYRYRHLSNLNFNNIITSGDSILYNIECNEKAYYKPDSALEKFMLLDSYVRLYGNFPISASGI